MNFMMTEDKVNSTLFHKLCLKPTKFYEYSGMAFDTYNYIVACRLIAK
jgi:hypothetical protein